MLKNLLVHRTFMFFVCLTVASFAIVFSSISTNAQAVSFTSNYTETIPATAFSGCAGSNLTVEG
jgi:hypothetical protein